MKAYWTDAEMIGMMVLCFVTGLLLAWFIRTIKSIK